MGPGHWGHEPHDRRKERLLRAEHAHRRTVRFGDGLVAEIQGSGTAVFVCKNGEHRALTGGLLPPPSHSEHRVRRPVG
jgi:hypothetical protein